jgi:serine/threonine protein phosphatase 1
MRYRSVPENTQGRDFIVGDLHGAFNALTKLLHNAAFDSTYDRLFLVGDTIDRGDKSELCLQLLLEDWVFAVAGNHEKTFCDMVDGNNRWATLEDYWSLRWGGSWTKKWFSENAPDLKFWADIIRDLPYVIHVDNKRSSPFWVVHAELWHPSIELNSSNIQRYVEYATADEIDIFQWKRHVGNGRKLSYPPSLPGPIYCGHTPTPTPGDIKQGHLNMDGGAGVGGYGSVMGVTNPQLVMRCHQTNQMWSTPVEQRLA